MREQTFAVCEPDLSHRCRGRLFPESNVKCSGFASCGQLHWTTRMFHRSMCSDTHVGFLLTSNTERVNDHVISIQYVAGRQCKDVCQFRLEMLRNAVTTPALLVEARAAHCHDDCILPNELKRKGSPRSAVLKTYSRIRLHSRKSRTGVSSNVLYNHQQELRKCRRARATRERIRAPEASEATDAHQNERNDLCNTCNGHALSENSHN